MTQILLLMTDCTNDAFPSSTCLIYNTFHKEIPSRAYFLETNVFGYSAYYAVPTQHWMQNLFLKPQQILSSKKNVPAKNRDDFHYFR